MDFTPPFCPNRNCTFTPDLSGSGQNWFRRKGFRPTRVVGPVPRFQCRHCGAGFSQRTFDIDYWVHRSVDYQLVQNLLVGGSGLRQSCRTLGVSTRLLANRHARLARQSLALHARCMEDFRLSEPLAFDGFESFTYSQYYPNNIHLLVTSQSQFVVAMQGVPLRRKGRMTDKQREKRRVLEQDYRPPPNAIFKSSKELLNLGCHLAFDAHRLPVEFRTDEKKEYGWALQKLPVYSQWREAGLLIHWTTNSKVPRTRFNPLFPVNYLDRQLRKDLAEHVRETVRFARRLEHSLERAVIHLAHHNYFKVFRSRSSDQRVTHAEAAGMERNTVAEHRKRSLSERAFGWRIDLEGWQNDLWRRLTKVPVHHVTPLARHLQSA